ncbi:GNAT family N-acetyltransferase [Candidatus Thioglobus sp.]|uniref:GNAT family N-acetyltransferase n=1 Tax=Candidatus Thioglobus sp. TaxID=2026721 RepID=UPI003D12A501
MQVSIVNNLAEVDSLQWNQLITDNNPFCKHEFLNALELHNCVGKQFGWIPRHIIVTENNQLIGAAILYEKYNNYGEFVFDHVWHNAYETHGLNYYPKLTCAIPYTPASGVRFLSSADNQKRVFPALLDTIYKICEKINASSFHCLFPNDSEFKWMKSQKLFIRNDCQFHWINQNYVTFDDFLANLKQKKRKNIRQERSKIQKLGVNIRQLDGNTATQIDWQNFSNFYSQTFLEKSGTPTLNLDFFKSIAKTMPEQILLFLADVDGQCVAGSLMFKSDTHLYGRHWGCCEQIDYLHFEVCYYQGIEYAIKHKLKVFEPGAQGEHKVARGFIPTLTKSTHWIKDQGFKQPIKDFCQMERQHIKKYMQQVNTHNPYKQS